jgi:hypothetical protein
MPQYGTLPLINRFWQTFPFLVGPLIPALPAILLQIGTIEFGISTHFHLIAQFVPDT